MIKRILISLLLLTSLLTAPLLAASGTSGGQIVEIIPDARSAAMGGAYCAVGDDTSCLSYNPAGIGQIRHTEILLSNVQLPADVQYQHVTCAYSLRDIRSVTLNEPGTLAIGFSFLDSGHMIARDTSGNSLGTFSERDCVLSVAYAKPLYRDQVRGSVLAGVNMQFVSEEILEKTSKNTCTDAGILWMSPSNVYSAGLALQNAGREFGYSEEQFGSPETFMAGVSYRPMGKLLLLSADMRRQSDDRKTLHFGTEYLTARALVLRAGFENSRDEGNGITLGGGILLNELDIFFWYAHEVSIDYAFISTGDLGTTHQLSLVLKLGAD